MACFSAIFTTSLMRLIQTPVLINVCIPEDFAPDPYLVPTAQRITHSEVMAAALALHACAVVAICQESLKLSLGAATLLPTQGVRAKGLACGSVGWAEVRFPRIPDHCLPETCLWLIRRLIDRQARFLCVPPAEIFTITEKCNVFTFDVSGEASTHYGPLYAFGPPVKAFGLRSAAVMARFMGSTDTNDYAPLPETAGLLALCVGLSSGVSDDLEPLDTGLMLCGAPYRWACAGKPEDYEWQEAA